MAVLCWLHTAYGNDFIDGIRAGLRDEDVREWPNVGDPLDVDICVVYRMPRGFLKQFPNLKLVSSTGAGVDHYLSDPTMPTGIPLVRVIDSDSAARMAEYVLCWVLFHHRRVAAFQAAQLRRTWSYEPIRSARDVRVGVMGLGHMGQAACRLLASVGYTVSGWSRTPGTLPHVDCHHGSEAFAGFLAGSEILVNLLPLTSATRGILCRRTFDALPRGSVLISAGRGGHLIGADLEEALASGQLRAATVDAFPDEPLADDSPFWAMPNLHVTPHCSSTPSLDTVVEVICDNIRRFRANMPFRNLVDPARGY